MDYIDLYKKRLGMSGKTLSEAYINNTQRYIDNTFKESPNLKKAIHLGKEIDVRFTSSKRINNLTGATSNYKKVLFQDLKYHTRIGDYIEFDNSHWIIIDKDDNLRNSVTIEKCNYALKWKDKFNKIHSMPCYAENATFYSLGVKFDEINTPDLKLKVIMPWNEETQYLYLGQRFLFHKRSAYMITSLDYTQVSQTNCHGTLGILMTQKGASILSKDDLDNDLAYNGSLDYDLSIKEDVLSLSIGDILQLNPILYVDNQLQNNNDYEYEWDIDNEEKAHIDDNGLLTCVDNGTINVTVKLKNNKNITDSVTYTIGTAISDNVEVELNGDTTITWTTNRVFKASRIVNGIEDKEAKFNFTIDYQENDKNIVSLETIDNTSCKIIANDKQIRGTVILKCKNVEEEAEFKNVDINIIGFFE